MTPILSPKKGVYFYNGISYDSKEEIYFLWYLDELKAAGFIDSFRYHPPSFLLSEPVKYSYSKQLKTKIKHIEKALLQPHSYRADFYIWWHPKANGFLFSNKGNKKIFPFIAHKTVNIENATVIDVKPIHDMHNMTRQFHINQKWVYQKLGIYVQKIVPTKLFESTFTPERYLFTDKSLKPRKLAFQPVCLKAFKGIRL